GDRHRTSIVDGARRGRDPRRTGRTDRRAGPPRGAPRGGRRVRGSPRAAVPGRGSRGRRREMTRGEVRWIGRLWRPFAVFGVLIVTLTIVNTIARVALPLVLKRTFDGFETSLTSAGLASAVLLYLALGPFEWAGATGLIFMRGSMNLKFEMAARLNAYARLVHHAPGFFQKYRTGDLVTRLTDDVSEKLSWFICSGIFRCFAAVMVVVFAVVMMIRLDPLLTLYTV